MQLLLGLKQRCFHRMNFTGRDTRQTMSRHITYMQLLTMLASDSQLARYVKL
jgi:hypothetical protein